MSLMDFLGNQKDFEMNIVKEGGRSVRLKGSKRVVEELGLPVGYAVCDEEAILEVVCQGCRLRYFQGVKAFRTLDDLQQKPTFI